MESSIDMEVISRDIPKAITFLKDIAGVATDMEQSMKNVLKKVDAGDYDCVKGLSFFNLKCHLMLSYLINMCHLVLQKCNGRSIESDSSILRLVEYRTVLEKMRPIEQKLKYHIDKLVKVSAGIVNEKDPLSFRANPQNLISKLGDDDDISGSDDESGKANKSKDKVKAYIPPKLAAVPYDGDNGNEMREQRQLEHARKRALSSAIMRELKAEYFEGPEEIKDRGESARKRESHDAKRKREYEEEYMTRLPVTKKEKALEKRRANTSGLDGLTNFGDTSFLSAEDKGIGYGIVPKKPKITKKTNKSKTKKGGKRFKKGKRK